MLPAPRLLSATAPEKGGCRPGGWGEKLGGWPACAPEFCGEEEGQMRWLVPALVSYLSKPPQIPSPRSQIQLWTFHLLLTNAPWFPHIYHGGSPHLTRVSLPNAPWSSIIHFPLGAYMCACSVASVRSDSLRPYGLWPTRLLCAWESPGKNTGVGCHGLLQGIFPAQGSNPRLLYYRWILYHWATREALCELKFC